MQQQHDIPGGPQVWAPFLHLFRTQTVPARTLLLPEGEVAQTIYLVEKGCLRSWFNQDGKDITFQFFFEGQGVSSAESFFMNQPSLFNISSIEPTVLSCLSRQDFETISRQSPAIREMLQEHLLNRLFFYQKLFLSRIRSRPEQRYQELLQEHPEIFQRVPQHYIASFLGITSVSLSRIRNRRT